jgi:hypothetical protein
MYTCKLYRSWMSRPTPCCMQGSNFRPPSIINHPGCSVVSPTVLMLNKLTAKCVNPYGHNPITGYKFAQHVVTSLYRMFASPVLPPPPLRLFHLPSSCSLSSSSSLARQLYVGPGLSQKLLPAKVSVCCFFRFRDNRLFQGEVVSPTPNPRLSWRADVFCLSRLVPILKRQDLAFFTCMT